MVVAKLVDRGGLPIQAASRLAIYLGERCGVGGDDVPAIGAIYEL